MNGNVEIHVRAYNDAGEEVEARVTTPAAESDLRLAAFAAMQHSGLKVAKELGLSPKEMMKVMTAGLGAMARTLSEHGK